MTIVVFKTIFQRISIEIIAVILKKEKKNDMELRSLSILYEKKTIVPVHIQYAHVYM